MFEWDSWIKKYMRAKNITCICLQMNNFATFGEILNPGFLIRPPKRPVSRVVIQDFLFKFL